MKQILSRPVFATLAVTLVVATAAIWSVSRNDEKIESRAKSFPVTGGANGTPWTLEIDSNKQGVADPENGLTQLMQSATDAENDSAPLMQMATDAENNSAPLMEMATDAEKDSTPMIQMVTEKGIEATPQMQIGPLLNR